VNNGSGDGGSCFGIGMDGYSEADEYGNSKIWRQVRSSLVGKSEVFIKYEADVSSRVSGGE